MAKRVVADRGISIRLACETFGISEILKAEQVLGLLQQKDIDGFARAMKISHNGDRVKNISPEVELLKQVPESVLSDDSAGVTHLSGDYHCSHPDIDDMVDIAQSAGALSGRICGAGLGGTMMVLTKKDRVDQIVDAMNKQYYGQRKLSCKPIIAVPVEGAGNI